MALESEFAGWPACEICGKDTDPEKASLSLHTEAAYMRVKGQGLWETEQTEEVRPGLKITHYGAGYPASIEWLWAHKQCFDDESVDRYVIDGSRLDSPAKVLDWTLHLQFKAWYDGRAWEKAVRRFFNLSDNT